MQFVGERFGFLSVLSEEPKRNSRRQFKCLCGCGAEVILSDNRLKSGQRYCSRRCSLLASLSDRSEYSSWHKMKQKCTNPSDRDYPEVGGVGIKFCDRWQEFRNFLEDMGPRPDDRVFGRLDVTKDFCPENCRWMTLSEFQATHKNVVKITIDGETRGQSEWARIAGLNLMAFKHRLQFAKTEEDLRNCLRPVGQWTKPTSQK